MGIIQSSDLKAGIALLPPHTGSMYFPALLYTCILSMLFLIDGIPIHPDRLEIFKLQADNIIKRIEDHNNKLQLHPNLHIENPELNVLADKPIQGLVSIVETLTTIQKVLPKGHVSTIRSYVSTLLRYFNEMMTNMNCTPKEPANGGSLDAFLEEYATHHVTLRHITLDKLKQFLQNLKANLDQLKSC